MLEHPHISVVQNDLHRGVQAAVEHLISLGHRAIGMLAGLYLEVGGHYRARYQGYLDALAQASITFQPEWVVLSEPVISAGQQAARELLTALLVFAGLQTIPKSVYKAAAIDGADEVRTFFNITLPLLRPVLVFVLVTSVIGSFQIFDTIAITTRGGPVDATRVIYWYIYEYAFNRFNMGYATTISVALFAILIVITMLQMRYLRADSSDV